MGRRAGRRRPTRAEKIRRNERPTSNVQRPMLNKKNKDEKQRRAVSPEALEIGRAYAEAMGWSLERVLPHAAGAEG